MLTAAPGTVSLNVSRLEALEQLYREGVKLAEEELKILNDEPDDLIRNLEMLASIRAAFEADTPRATTAMKPRGLKRRFDADGSADSPAQTPEVSTPAPASRVMSKAASRSGSVAASSIKAEAASESGDAMDGTLPEKLGVVTWTDRVTNSKLGQAHEVHGGNRSLLPQ